MTEQTMLVHMLRADQTDVQGDLFPRAVLGKAATGAVGVPVLDEGAKQIGKVLSAWVDDNGQVWIKADGGKGLAVATMRSTSIAHEGVRVVHRCTQFEAFTATWLTEGQVLLELVEMTEDSLAKDGLSLGPSAMPPPGRKECNIILKFANPLYSVVKTIEPGFRAMLAAFDLSWLTVTIEHGEGEA